MKEIGIDIVSIERIRKIYKKFGNKFLEKILTKDEYDYLKKIGLNRQILRISGIFAAKEAIVKCFNGKIFFKDIKIIYEKSGKPRAFVNNIEVLISISHEKDYAIAIAMLK